MFNQVPSTNEQGQQPAGQPVVPEQGSTTPVTAADVKQMLQEALHPVVDDFDQKLVKAFRAAQSDQAKREKAILLQVTAQVNNLRGIGVELNDAQVQAMKQQALESQGEEEGTPAPGQAQTPQSLSRGATTPAAAPDPVADLVNAQVADLYQESGVTIEQDDPEASTLDMTNPVLFMKTLRNAVEAKKIRLETSPQARIPAVGRGTPTRTNYSKMKGIDILNEAFKR